MLVHALEGLRPIRYVRRLDRAELADAIGVTSSSYTRFERGERRAYFDKVCVLADYLGVRTDDLRKTLTEDAAKQLCDVRDKEAIANGTFDPSRWTRGDKSVPAPPMQVPPPPSASPGAALDGDIVVSAPDGLSDWHL